MHSFSGPLQQFCSGVDTCGRDLVQWFFVLTATAYNLVRIPKLLAATQ